MNARNTRLFRASASLVFGLLLILPASAQTQNGQDPALTAKFAEYMDAAVKVNKFSGSVLVARDGKAIFSRGYGMANYEWDIPNTPQTAFRIGSITKQFTSAAIMLLQERGKLNVNDSVCKYVTECPAAWEPITIRHVLTHTSGIPNYTSFPKWMETKAVMPVTPAELLAEYKTKPLDFAPGEKYSYSNSGYHLLGLIIEKTSGKPYADFLTENIFVPLGLKNTGYDLTKNIIKHRASGYVRDGDGVLNAAYLDMLIPYAAGSLYSTTEDLLRFEQAFYSEKLLTRKSLDETFTPFKGNYGYGWGVGKRQERTAMSHSGGIYGFSAYYVRYPDDKATVIVLTNVQGSASERVADSLSSILFGTKYELPKERKAITLSPQVLEKYVGEYQLNPTTSISVTLEDGKLILNIINSPKMEIFAESETDFFVKTIDALIKFEKDPTGKVTLLRLIVGGRGNGMSATKVK